VEFVVLGVVIVVVFLAALVAFLRAPSRRELPPAERAQVTQTPAPTIETAPPSAPEQLAPTLPTVATAAPAPDVEMPPPSAGRMVRLRSRLSRSFLLISHPSVCVRACVVFECIGRSNVQRFDPISGVSLGTTRL